MNLKKIISLLLATAMLITLTLSVSVSVFADTVFVSCDFETGEIPDGWTVTGSTDFYVASASNNGAFSAIDGFAAYCDGDSGTDTSSLVTDAIDLGDFDTASLNFYYMNPIWAGDCNIVSVSWSTKQNGTFSELWTSGNVFSGTWAEQTVSLDSICGQVVYLSFNSTSGHGYCTGFDNITVSSDITRIDAVEGVFLNPVNGGSPSFDTSIPASYDYTATVKWWLGNVELTSDYTFLENITYKREIYFAPKDAFFAYDSVVDGRGQYNGTVTINGGEPGTYFVVADSTSPYFGQLCVQEHLMPVDSYTVIFDENGHGTAPDAIFGIAFGDKISQPDAPTADGWLFAGWYTDSELTKPFDFYTDSIMSDVHLYAKWVEGDSVEWFAVSLYGGSNQNKWITFDTNRPEDSSVVASESSGFLSHAAMYIDGYVYGCNSINNYIYKASFDGTSFGEYKVLNTDNQYKLYDMSFDPVSDTLYAVGDKGSETFLLTVDTETGAVEPVAQIDNYINTLAIDDQGNAFCISINTDKLYRINLSNGARTEVGDLNYDANYVQSLEFDKDTGILYWASCGTVAPFTLRVLDTETAVSFSLGTVECSTGLELGAMFAFYAMADLSEYNSAVNRAANLNSTAYTAESWQLLQDALSVDVSRARLEDQKMVDDATTAILAAIDALDPVLLLGDVNNDGVINSTDYFIAKRLVLGTYNYNEGFVTRGDIDGNGKIDTTDYIKIKRHVLGTYVIP